MDGQSNSTGKKTDSKNVLTRCIAKDNDYRDCTRDLKWTGPCTEGKEAREAVFPGLPQSSIRGRSCPPMRAARRGSRISPPPGSAPTTSRSSSPPVIEKRNTSGMSALAVRPEQGGGAAEHAPNRKRRRKRTLPKNSLLLPASSSRNASRVVCSCAPRSTASTCAFVNCAGGSENVTVPSAASCAVMSFASIWVQN